MNDIITINNLSKVYANGFGALTDVNLSIHKGEIFALLGPNGAGKTTLIGIICGTVNKTSGTVTVMGKDNITDYRFTRSVIGLVPQELYLDIFLTVEQTLTYARGFYGKAPNQDLVERVMADLSLADKRNEPVERLSGGMKRRVLIGKALMNEPKVLFLDEPTAGVDVELRKDMWKVVQRLKEHGTTIILTTHYIEEAEEMADRIGVITGGHLKMVEEKTALMKRLGTKRLEITLDKPIDTLPTALAEYDLKRADDGTTLCYDYSHGNTGITKLLTDLKQHGLRVHDIETQKSSLEDIFVDLIHES